MIKNKIQYVLHLACVINMFMLLVIAVYMTLILGLKTTPTNVLWQTPMLSLLTAFSGLIYPQNKSIGKIEMIVRVVIHYLLITTIVLVAGACFGWYNPHNLYNIFYMVAMITSVFIFVSVVSWVKVYQDAKKINEKLKERDGL